MVTRRQSATNTPVNTSTYVSHGPERRLARSGSLGCIAAAAGRLHRTFAARGDGLQSHRSSTSIIAANNASCAVVPPNVAQLHLLGQQHRSTAALRSTAHRRRGAIAKIAPTMMLLLLLLHAAAAKIRGVQVLAVGTKPELGGPLNTQAAQKAQNKDIKYIKKKKPRKQLAHDAARWFGSRGYVVDDVGVNTQTMGDDELVVLSARVLPCGPIRLRAANGTRVITKPATVARALGLRRGQPFRWDPTRLAALIREDGGLFKPDATRARASVEDGVVALDLTVAEPSYRTILRRNQPVS